MLCPLTIPLAALGFLWEHMLSVFVPWLDWHFQEEFPDLPASQLPFCALSQPVFLLSSTSIAGIMIDSHRHCIILWFSCPTLRLISFQSRVDEMIHWTLRGHEKPHWHLFWPKNMKLSCIHLSYAPWHQCHHSAQFKQLHVMYGLWALRESRQGGWAMRLAEQNLPILKLARTLW